MTPAGIEPATFRFVAQHLSHCATAVPIYICIYINNGTSVESRQCEQHSCFLFERSLVQISAWRPDVLPEASPGVDQSLNTHVTTVSPATPLHLPSAYFPVHYSLFIPQFDAQHQILLLDKP